MATEVQLKLLIDTASSAKSVSEVKTALKNIKSELLNIEDTASPQFRSLAGAAGELQDKMDDMRETLNAFKGGGTFTAIAQSATGLASGFQAAQGAMGLFGSESKNLEKMLLKVQSATAFAQGLQGLEGLGHSLSTMRTIVIDGVKQLVAWASSLTAASVAQGILTAATKAFQAVISPLGLVITGLTAAIGGLVYYFNEEAKATEEATKAAERYKKIHDEVLKTELDNWEKIRELQNQRKTGRAKELADELLNYQKSVRGLKEKTSLTQSEQKLMEEQLETYNFNVAAINKKYDDIAKAEAEKKRLAEEEAEKKRREKIQKRFEGMQEMQSINIAENEIEKNRVDNQIQEDQREIQSKEGVSLAEQALLQQKIANANASLQIATDVTNGIASLGNMFIKDSEKLKKFNKRIALTQLAIDSGKALASAVAAAAANPTNAATFGVAGALQYAAAAATILSNIAKARNIINGADSGSGGTSLSTTSAPKTTATVPTASLPRSTQSSPIQQQGQQFQQVAAPIKVYVTETDISNSQKRVGTIQQRATIK